MKEVKAIIQPSRLYDVVVALREIARIPAAGARLPNRHAALDPVRIVSVKVRPVEPV